MKRYDPRNPATWSFREKPKPDPDDRFWLIVTWLIIAALLSGIFYLATTQ